MLVNSVLLLSICTVSTISQSSYCSITPSHSLCGSSGPSSSCGSVYYRGLTQAEKQEALEHHNRLRSRVAMGQTNQPSAGDMMELRWDDELAAVAQGHADNCVFVHDCRDCRRVPRFRVGQNIYRAKDYKYEAPEWRKVIQSWWDEIYLFPGLGSIASYRYTPYTGHYTQMTWASITSVGCALITHKNSDTEPFIARFYVCNYGPGGNFVGRKMYQPGRACSACPGSSSCTSSYPGLCSTSSLSQGFSSTQLSPRMSNTTSIVSNIIPQESVRTRVSTSLATRREPRLSDSRFSARAGVVNTRQRQARPARITRPRNNRRQSYSACRNILCTLARFFQ